MHCRYSYSFLRVVLFIILLTSISACVNDPNEILALTSKPNQQIDKAEDIVAISSKNGKIKARLFAHQYIRNSSAQPPYIDLNKTLKVEFYNDSGEIQNVLTADSCRYYESLGNILVWDSVQIVSKKGEILKTSELIWNQKIQKFFTEKPVRIITATQILIGEGMEANQDFTWYKISNPKGTVQVNKAEVPK